MRVKICGITNVADALAAVEAGADAIGLNFATGPRRIDVTDAAEIVRAVPPFVTLVALFVDERPARIGMVCEQLGIGTVQLHGGESVEYVAALEHLNAIKVFRVARPDFAAEVRPYVAGCPWLRGVLLDAYVPQVPGGSGATFCWEWVETARSRGQTDGWPPIILAGGLTADNVAEAVRVVRPYAVDVASGVESAPGKKDPAKVAAFIRNAKAAMADADNAV
jgi:phosphoribosylanthranilate isomerase